MFSLLLFGIDVHRDDTIFLLLAIGGLCRSGVPVSAPVRSSWGFRMEVLLSDGMGYVPSFYGVGDLESSFVSCMVLII